MGIIEKYRNFKQNRYRKSIAKNLKLVKNPKAVREDRAAAIDFFASLKEAKDAVPPLLLRFDYSLEHGINDTREKEAAMAGIVSFGESALEFVRKHLKETTRIAWPIKVVKSLAKEDVLIEVLESCLDYGEVSFEQKYVDKNYDILCYLMDYKLPHSAKALLHFVSYHDERVRFAAVEVLLEQEDPLLAQDLEAFLVDESSENTRIRQAVLQAFAKNGWVIQNKASVAQGSLPSGFKINKQSQLVLEP